MSDFLRNRFENVELTPGTGRISAFISVSLGFLAILGALCFLFPTWLTMPELRPFYSTHRHAFEWLLYVLIITSVGFGLFSIYRQQKYGFLGLILATLAAILGSGQIDVPSIHGRSIYAGLDYFILTLLLLAVIFIPLEMLFPKNPNQKILRQGWVTDMKYFMLSHIGVQLLSFFTIIPVQTWLTHLSHNPLPVLVQQQPIALQVIEILAAADFTTYWVHRAMHEIKFFWRFHAVHHSTLEMDWLASSRVHLGELIGTRFIGAIPIFLLGFSPSAVYAYLIFISFHAIFIHANVSFRFPILRWLIATPEFHHWHHSSEKPAIDKNYAAFLPIYDWLFKTVYMPNHLASQYGVVGYKVPTGFTDQMVYPVKKYINKVKSKW